jgi:hypothetical protein
VAVVAAVAHTMVALLVQVVQAAVAMATVVLEQRILAVAVAVLVKVVLLSLVEEVVVQELSSSLTLLITMR